MVDPSVGLMAKRGLDDRRDSTSGVPKQRQEAHRPSQAVKRSKGEDGECTLHLANHGPLNENGDSPQGISANSWKSPSGVSVLVQATQDTDSRAKLIHLRHMSPQGQVDGIQPAVLVSSAIQEGVENVSDGCLGTVVLSRPDGLSTSDATGPVLTNDDGCRRHEGVTRSDEPPVERGLQVVCDPRRTEVASRSDEPPVEKTPG